MEKKLKVILIALIAILLTMVSFVGIYTKNKTSYKNILADYLLDKNLSGSRVFELSIDKSTNKVTYDENGNIVENDDENSNTTNTETTDGETTDGEDKSNYTTEDVPVNPEESLNENNYIICKEIIEKRLETLNITDYMVKLNTENGKIIVEVPENSQVEDVESYLTSIGSFEIVDAEDGTSLINNNDLNKAQVAYNSDTTGTTVYLTIEFNEDGKQKMEDISNKYTLITGEDGKTTQKKVTIKMENEDILSTYFAEPITNGQIQLTVGKASTDAETVQEYIKSAAGISMLLNCGKMPIIYTIESEEYIKPVVGSDVLAIAIYVLIGIFAISFIYSMIKNKKYGALAFFSSIIAIDLLLLIIRYTNVYLSVESAIAFVALILLNIYIVSNLTNNIDKESSKEDINKAIKNGWLKSIDMLVVMLIISVVFTFISWSAIANVGILMFWGIICIGISHLIFTRILLLNSNK